MSQLSVDPNEVFAVDINSVKVENRVRKDLGNIDELCNSIRAVGIIQPIVLYRNDMSLAAGERRLTALKRIGVTQLFHAKHFIFNDEMDDVKRKAIECEENLKRKAFTWQEEILAKKRLYDLMQQIHGVAQSGRPTQAVAQGVVSGGFGVNKLASLLGESNAQTSKDLELARYIEALPELAKAETKEAARKQVLLGTAVAIAMAQAKANPSKNMKLWTLYEGDFINNVNNIDNESVDLICTDPPYGEETQGMGPNSQQLLANPFADGKRDCSLFISEMLTQSYRILRKDRFAVFFFGFAIYSDLVVAARLAGFTVDTTPLIWVKNTVINTSPYTRYGRSYEPILICRKGEPKLIVPSQRDVITIANVTASGGTEQKFYHAQKPVALIEKLILDMTSPLATIVDFCAGSGTAGIAAIQQKRNVVLFEKDPTACNIIRTRLEAL